MRTITILYIILVPFIIYSCQDPQVIYPENNTNLLNSTGEVKKPVITYDGNTVIVTPVQSTAALINPRKGWVAYGSADKQPTEVLNMVSLGYTRYRWGNIEPEEGVFRWDLIDNDIRSWADKGKDFAFGVACASTHSNDFWVTPKWVFDAGAQYDTFNLSDPKLQTTGTPGLKLVPVFDDPVFMTKLEHFIQALAARYDGHPNLAFIDVRSYGNWGEGHMYPFGKPDISPEKYKEHIQLHIDSFKKTSLVVPGGNKKYESLYDWAVSVGVGIRRDGICGNSNGNETSRCVGKMPGVFEFFGPYEMLVELGWWYGTKDKNGYGYSPGECVENGKPSYCDLSRGGTSGLNLLRSEPALVSKLANRMGYHFVLAEAKYPKSITIGSEATLSLTWINRGVANIFIPVKANFAILTTGGVVMEVCDATASVPSSWKSDTPVTVSDKVKFSNLPKGSYILAVGILRPNDGKLPSIRLGIEQRRYDGWYELGPVIII